jgi:hypothetical protein
VRFDLKRPCDNCPFRRRGGVRYLAPARVMEIAHAMLDFQGSTFACHKTTVEEEDEEGMSRRSTTASSQHCAGALIFAEKNGNANQYMRIAEQLGLYDAKALMADKKVVALVFDNVNQMLVANRDGDKPLRRKK